MKELVYVNPNKEDNCDINKLNSDWKNIYIVQLHVNTLYIM